MLHVDLGTLLLLDQPVASDGDITHTRRIGAERFLPGREVERAGKWREHHELREGQVRKLGDRECRLERTVAVAWQAEDERAEDVHTVFAECSEAINQRVAALVERLVYIFQPFGRDRFHADERTLDMSAAHRIEELFVLGRLHRDLREEDRVRRETLE